MNVTSKSAVESDANAAVSERPPPGYISMVDPFLVEALQNPRHRLTILRMELDIQKFLRNSDPHQFEFPHFPTSYLRLAAHRVAQHYGLQTMMVQDGSVDGQSIRISVTKKLKSKFPAVCLSEVPVKEPEKVKLDQIKVVLKPRPKASLNDASEPQHKCSLVRSVEERKDEYERARARIFSSSESGDVSPLGVFDGRSLNAIEEEVSRSFVLDGNKRTREIGSSSRVAIFRDREKDMTDPDYDRSYDRYVKSIPNVPSFNLAPFSMPSFQPPFVRYDSGFPQLGQMPAPQPSLNFKSPIMNTYSTVGFDQTSGMAYMCHGPLNP